MTDWTQARFADGPTLAAWFDTRDLPEHKADPTLHRRISYWRSGERASIETVDRHLTRLGYHLSELPDEVWLDCDPPKGPAATAGSRVPRLNEVSEVRLCAGPNLEGVGV